MKISLVALIFILSLSHVFANGKTVVLMGQWHLVSAQNTLDISKSKEFAQFPNQKAIYLILKEWINKKSISLILAEGCEGEINNSFKENFQGWDYHSLSKISENKNYEDVLTLLPLKLEAQYKDIILTSCVDNLALIKKHQLIFSDLRAYSGYYSNFKKYEKNKVVFKKFHKVLNESEKRQVKDPIIYTRKMILSLIDQEQNVLIERNMHILKKIKEQKHNKMALIIGHRHVKNLSLILKESGFNVLSPALLSPTLPEDNFIQKLKDAIQKD